MLCQDLILRPAVLCRLKDIHELLTGKCIKSHIVKDIGTAIEVTCIIMQCMCPVSKCGKCGCSTLCRMFLRVCLIWIFSRSEVTESHSCQYFKLCICRTGSH